MAPLATITVVVVALAVALCAVTDVWKFKVYNLITFPLLVLGLGYQTWVSGLSGLGAGLLGAVVGFGCLVVFYGLGGIGAGDVKLLAGLGAWLGAGLTFQVFLLAAIAAGLYGLTVMVVRYGLAQTRLQFAVMFFHARAACRHMGNHERIEEVVRSDDRRKRLIPFAVVTALAVLVVLTPRQLVGFDLGQFLLKGSL